MNPPKRRILVADDEESYRLILSSQLESAGYDVEIASDGEEAVRCLGTGKFDLALLDIRMPKMDGLDVLTHIKKHCPATKTIMLTGFADLKLAIEAKELGAVDFINKPFSIDDLMTSIKEALSS